jgi:hypothetical protein
MLHAFGLLVGWFGWSVGWLVGWLGLVLFGLGLVGWLVVGLVGWLVSWLVGWFVGCWLVV